MSSPELGCGLIAIGRQWGTTPEIPSEAEAIRFLQSAYDLGIRFFDTAPSYGLSEERLGIFLRGLSSEQRNGVTVATKFGEHWDSNGQNAYTDHSFEALKSSLDQSMQRLGQIAILQLHKANPALLASLAVGQALEYARALGITRLGVSVSDAETARLAMEDTRFSVVQMPYNQASQQFRPCVDMAREHDKFLLINRPFQMGQISSGDTLTDKQAAAVEAFRFILQEDFDGVVLSGTSNITHLQENIAAFELAKG